MEPKDEQKKHLIDMMRLDEEDGLYEEPNQALIDAAERYIAGDNYNRYYDDFINGARWSQQQNDTSKVTRVEVIQHSPPYNGRAFTKYNAKDVEIQFQDDGKTLKIFLI